jgi:8-oxo-dGTP pyrophosphatase MutT (NUDIX family)
VIEARGPGAPVALIEPGSRHSAVLVALFDGPDGAEVVLTRRSRHLNSHKGEVSFPGGRLDLGETPVQAALREAYEEVALDPTTVTIVGELDHVATNRSRNLIVPVVGTMPGAPSLHAATVEVDRVFTVPLAHLLAEDVYREERWGEPAVEVAINIFEVPGETVWGATARMLVQLLALATRTAT